MKQKSRINRLYIREISQKSDIVKVVGHFLPLIQKGKYFYAKCPFHNDNNPSLKIDPEKNTYHCYVDNHKGTSLKFVMEYKHINFIEAAKVVADIMGFDSSNIILKNNDDIKDN